MLTETAAIIRSSVQGKILTIVPKGQSMTILEFLKYEASDGYYWCRGAYGGFTGYFIF